MLGFAKIFKDETLLYDKSPSSGAAGTPSSTKSETSAKGPVVRQRSKSATDLEDAMRPSLDRYESFEPLQRKPTFERTKTPETEQAKARRNSYILDESDNGPED